MFYASPKFCVLDECTSAVSVDVEERLYRTANDMGIACITISQRLALPEFHSNELKLGENNAKGWTLRAIEPSTPPPAAPADATPQPPASPELGSPNRTLADEMSAQMLGSPARIQEDHFHRSIMEPQQESDDVKEPGSPQRSSSQTTDDSDLQDSPMRRKEWEEHASHDSLSMPKPEEGEEPGGGADKATAGGGVSATAAGSPKWVYLFGISDGLCVQAGRGWSLLFPYQRRHVGKRARCTSIPITT